MCAYKYTCEHNTHIYICINNYFKSHEFERKQRKIYARLWREKMEGGNYVIIIKS